MAAYLRGIWTVKKMFRAGKKAGFGKEIENKV